MRKEQTYIPSWRAAETITQIIEGIESAGGAISIERALVLAHRLANWIRRTGGSYGGISPPASQGSDAYQALCMYGSWINLDV
jgi:hypothetical protein